MSLLYLYSQADLLKTKHPLLLYTADSYLPIGTITSENSNTSYSIVLPRLRPDVPLKDTKFNEFQGIPLYDNITHITEVFRGCRNLRLVSISEKDIIQHSHVSLYRNGNFVYILPSSPVVKEMFEEYLAAIPYTDEHLCTDNSAHEVDVCSNEHTAALLSFREIVREQYPYWALRLRYIAILYESFEQNTAIQHFIPFDHQLAYHAFNFRVKFLQELEEHSSITNRIEDMKRSMQLVLELVISIKQDL
jgi:hypothetical protein